MSPQVLAVVLSALAGEHRFDAEIESAVSDAAPLFRVPPALVRAVIKQESGFNPHALTQCGAVGLMQVMPFNALKLGLAGEDALWVPALNILAGVRLLAALLLHYEGDVIAALVAYNSGPKQKLAPLPRNGETPNYVSAILRYWRQFDAGSR